MTRRRKGFTLIELLVVIAIIGILAAMLFPVFARARESAKKIQCLSNVKNIATAFQMYLSDWGKFMPDESNSRAIEFFNTNPGGGTRTWPSTSGNDCNHAAHANPYLRTAVVLMDYIGNKEVWRCPSASVMNGAQFIVPAGPNGDYLAVYMDSIGEWGREPEHWDTSGGPCYPAFPSGWGGEITDSILQQQMAQALSTTSGSEGARVFVQGIGTFADIEGVNPSKIKDSAWYAVCGDGGAQVEFWDLNGLIFPDYCRANACGWCSGSPGCCNADWANCPASQACGVPYDYHRNEDGTTGPFWVDGTIRKQFARHLGGSNVGFADGHAKWFLVDSLINAAAPVSSNPQLENLCGCIPTCDGS